MKPIFKTSKKKIIFFDLTNTLTDEYQSFKISFFEAIQNLTGRWSFEEPHSFAEQIWQDYMKESSKQRNSRKKRSHKERFVKCMQIVLAPYPIDLQQSFLLEIYKQIKLFQREHIVPVPNLQATLQSLSETYHLSIISNQRLEYVQDTLMKLSICPFFKEEHLFIPKKNTEKKPNIILYQRALRQCGVKPSEAVMVGNQWRTDIYGALKAKIDAVWIHPKHLPIRKRKNIGQETIVLVRCFDQLESIFQHKADH